MLSSRLRSGTIRLAASCVLARALNSRDALGFSKKDTRLTCLVTLVCRSCLMPLSYCAVRVLSSETDDREEEDYVQRENWANMPRMRPR